MKNFHRVKKEIGIAILDRFGWKCTECDSASALCIHHINRVPVGDQNYNEIDNLTVLCRKCHMSYHRKAGHVVFTGQRCGRRGKGNPPVVCSAAGCDRMQHAKGLCNKHYMRMLRVQVSNPACPIFYI